MAAGQREHIWVKTSITSLSKGLALSLFSLITSIRSKKERSSSDGALQERNDTARCPRSELGLVQDWRCLGTQGNALLLGSGDNDRQAQRKLQLYCFQETREKAVINSLVCQFIP